MPTFIEIILELGCYHQDEFFSFFSLEPTASFSSKSSSSSLSLLASRLLLLPRLLYIPHSAVGRNFEGSVNYHVEEKNHELEFRAYSQKVTTK